MKEIFGRPAISKTFFIQYMDKVPFKVTIEDRTSLENVLSLEKKIKQSL